MSRITQPLRGETELYTPESKLGKSNDPKHRENQETDHLSIATKLAV